MSSQLENAALASVAHYNGVPFYENILLTKPKEFRRTFREQFLSWPWKPWKFFKTIQIPDPDCYMMTAFTGKKVFMGHPETITKVVEDLNRYLKEKDESM